MSINAQNVAKSIVSEVRSAAQELVIHGGCYSNVEHEILKKHPRLDQSILVRGFRIEHEKAVKKLLS